MIIQKLDIMDVNETNLKSFNNKIKTMSAIVCFHANWCGHCQSLEPEWNNMIKNLNKNELNGLLARVEEKNLDGVDCDKDIKGYPTIRVFKDGKKYGDDYSGKREEKELTEFVKKMLSKSSNSMKQIQSGGKKKRKRKRKSRRNSKKTRRRRKNKKRNKTKKKKSNNRFSLSERFFKMISVKF